MAQTQSRSNDAGSPTGEAVIDEDDFEACFQRLNVRFGDVITLVIEVARADYLTLEAAGPEERFIKRVKTDTREDDPDTYRRGLPLWEWTRAEPLVVRLVRGTAPAVFDLCAGPDTATPVSEWYRLTIGIDVVDQAIGRALGGDGTSEAFDDAVAIVRRDACVGDGVDEAVFHAAIRTVMRNSEYTRKAIREREDVPARTLLYDVVTLAGEFLGGWVVVRQSLDFTLGDMLGIRADVERLVLRVRCLDEVMAGRSLALEKGRWDVTTNYVRRLAHDVRKPAYNARALAEQLASRCEVWLRRNRRLRKGDVERDEMLQSLRHLGAQLAALHELTDTQFNVSIDTLRRDAAAQAEPCRLADVIREASWLWNVRSGDRAVELVFETEPPGATARLSRLYVFEILGNLVSNAIAHARHAVTIRADLEPGVGEGDGAYVTFTVTDDGGPATPEALEAFRAVQQRQEHRLSRHGLRLTAFLLDVLGGEMCINPSRDGTSISVRIPEATASAADVRLAPRPISDGMAPPSGRIPAASWEFL